MICDKCIDREDCRIRTLMGKHVDSCKQFFPDLLADPEADRSPRMPMAPEDRAKPIQTRERTP